MASRALIARLSTATSSWVGSAITGIISSSRSKRFSIPGPSTLRSSGRMFSISGATWVGRTSSRWTRLKASNCAGQPRAALGRRQRIVGIALQLLVLDPLGDKVEPADDDRQQIVEVVRDAAGQLAERLHLLALAKLLLRGLQLGDVARFEQQIDDLAVRRRAPAAPKRRG